MTVEEVFNSIAPIVGITSMIGAPSSVGGRASAVPTLAAAREQYAKVKVLQDEATNDVSYWGYAGQVSYWKALCDVLEAAALVGPDSLPDVPLPTGQGVVMDSMAELERFGSKVLRLAQEAQA